MSLTYDLPWDRQPREPTKLKPSLARRTEAFVNLFGPAGLRNLVPGKPAVTSTMAGWGTSPLGVGARSTGTGIVSLGAVGDYPSGDFWIAIAFVLDSLTGDPVLVYKGPYGGVGYYLQALSTGKLQFFTAAAFSETPTGVVAVGQPCVAILNVVRSVSGTIYVNGINRTSTSAAHAATTSAAALSLGGYNNGGSNRITGQIAAYATGVGTLGESEIAEYSACLWRMLEPRAIPVPVSAGGGASGPVGRSDETDTSLALAGVQILAAGRADETDAALALAAVQKLATGRADESDAALALTPVQVAAVGLASETDTALALTSGASAPVGVATETDSALALVALQITATGRADEADAALALVGISGTAPGMATETDTAYSLAAVQIMLVGIAVEVDEALALQTPSVETRRRAAWDDEIMRQPMEQEDIDAEVVELLTILAGAGVLQ